MSTLTAEIAREMERRPPPSQAHQRYRPDIDGLRAIAVLPVILYHYELWCPGGYVGVDVFYVISGFLITRIIYDLTLERNFSFKEFYDRRIRRLFPALFVMLAVVTLWAAIRMPWFDLLRYGRSLVAATAYASNIYFYVTTGYFVESAETQPLLHTWSLAVEEQFYIVVPFFLIMLAHFAPKRWHAPIIAALSFASLVLCIAMTRVDTRAAFFLLPSRAWELGVGGLIAVAAPPVWKVRWLADLLSIAGLALILFAVVTFSEATAFPGWRALIPTLGAGAILSTGGRSGAIVERLLGTAPMTFIGKISYSLYLWHWPVFAALVYGSGASPGKSLLAIVVTFVAATLSWRFVELPFRDRRFLATQNSLFAGAAICSFGAVAAGALFIIGDGFPHPKSLTALVEDPSLNATSPGCSRLNGSDILSNHVCVRGARNRRPVFALVGDSHGSAIADGFFAAAARRGVAGVQLTSNGFLPLPGRRPLTSREPLVTRRTGNMTEAVIRYLRAHPELRTIYVAAFWQQQVTGESYRDTPQIQVDDEYDGSGTAYNPISFDRALDRLVAMFPDREFVFLDDNPAGFDLDLQAYARKAYGGQTPPIGLPRAAYQAERMTYDSLLANFAARHPNVTYVRLMETLCGADTCPLMGRDGKPLYRNGDHLSHLGALRLSPTFERVLR